MRRYRYRTSVLTGPWRDAREDAVDDAVRAKQAEIEDEKSGKVRWIVPGVIEDTMARRQAAPGLTSARSSRVRTIASQPPWRSSPRRTAAAGARREPLQRRVDVGLRGGELAQGGEPDPVAGVARGEALDQVAAVAAAMIGGEREQRLGRRCG